MSHRQLSSLRLLTRRHLSRGQGMTEYIIVVALIAIAAIATTTYFGRTVRTQVAVMAAGLTGNQAAATQAQQQATDASNNANTQAQAAKGLNNFGADVGAH